MRILAAGGGSGGHVTPIIAVLEEVNRLSGEPPEVFFVCDRAFLSRAGEVIKSSGLDVRLKAISAGKLRRYQDFRFWDYLKHPSVAMNNIVDFFKVVIGFFQSLFLMVRWRPDTVFFKGGFVCLPIGFAAKLLHIPIVIHDSDARPGLTSKVLAPLASAIATGFPLEYYHYPERKSVYTGVPVRKEFSLVSKDRQDALKKQLSIPPSQALIVSLGGSLGAKVINNAIVDATTRMKDKAIKIICISGVKHYDEVSKSAEPYAGILEVRDFVSTGMADLLGAADIVVSRASATALQELSALGKPVIAVPASQLGDQVKNADFYHKIGAAVILSDRDLQDGKLADRLLELIDSPDERTRLSGKMHSLAVNDSAQKVARLIIKTIEGRSA